MNKDESALAVHCAEVTAEPQFLGQDPVQVVHDVVEDDQSAQIGESTFPQENEERQNAQYRNDVRKVAVNVLQ